MKNLFYVCLIAIISLGSTGFTTAEEMESSNSEALQENCFTTAWAAYELVYTFSESHEEASQMADYFYEQCLDDGGCEANC